MYWQSRHTEWFICELILCLKVKSESHSVVSNSLLPHQLYSPWNSAGHSIGLGSLSLLQEVFLTQGLNPGLLHCRQILNQLNRKGSPILCLHSKLSVFFSQIYIWYLQIMFKNIWVYIHTYGLPRWCSAGDAGDTGLISWVGRSSGWEMATHSSILA